MTRDIRIADSNRSSILRNVISEYVAESHELMNSIRIDPTASGSIAASNPALSEENIRRRSKIKRSSTPRAVYLAGIVSKAHNR
jgi:hypothetical protein